MQLEHQFSVPVPVAQAWDVLLDVERIAPCMPGATVESFDGETIVGRVKVKVGPIQVTYSGTARFTDRDEAARRAVLEASAKEARGSGTATATITAQLQDDGGSATNVTVTTDLAITGKPAQFGRGVMEEVGNKLLGRFADCLADTLGSGDASDSSTEAAAEPAPAAAAAATAPAADTPPAAAVAAATVGTPTPAARPSPAPTPLRRPVENDAIDLLDTAGLPLLKRAAPVIIGLVVFFLFWRLVRRR
jgi:carbon monoxide dehydrogenase subunit G